MVQFVFVIITRQVAFRAVNDRVTGHPQSAPFGQANANPGFAHFAPPPFVVTPGIGERVLNGPVHGDHHDQGVPFLLELPHLLPELLNFLLEFLDLAGGLELLALLELADLLLERLELRRFPLEVGIAFLGPGIIGIDAAVIGTVVFVPATGLKGLLAVGAGLWDGLPHDVLRGF